MLEAETGSGKTEAALARFLRLFHAGVVDGLYFALPTRTAAVQIHRRVTQAIARAFARSDSPPPVVLAVPGYLSVDDHVGQRLAPFDVLWAEDDRERWRDRGWAAESPKRYLAGAVVVGTVDQVLLSALAVPHSHLRAAGLARHLLVIDEVHASDAYMTHILEAVLARHVGGGGHALLLSATLGATARERLLAPGRGAPVPPVEDAEAVPYPLITHAAPPTGRTARIPLPPAADRRVRVQLAALAADPAAIAAAALDAARSGARVLVIRNTVRECIETQVALEAAALPSAAAEPGAGADARPPTAVALLRCAGVPAPHHARFAREDRLALDAVIEACFGRAAPPTACVAVATQTVQQSLDLDADLLFTDLCPLDVLLQRLGRLHRHRRPRPCGFEQPRVVVLVPPDRDLTRFVRADGRASGPHGLGTVYPDLRVLEATWRELERNPLLELPRMNRPLVEAATHPASLHGIAEELGGAWRTHDQWITGTLLAHVRIAGNHLARWDLRFPEALFPADGARIGTRLGAEDRIAEFSTPIPGPFGTAIRRLILPHHLVRGAAADAGPEDIEIADDVVTFRFGERSYRYDRLGLRAADTTTPGNEEDDD
ncbi:MAG: hypothetical protein IRZ13_17915 [Acetobacteraceae bacterium]|nr:hypothetical protein [Acetobacteraceae bacterium]